MCGIAGIIDSNHNMINSPKVIKAMSDSLSLRGPDQDGVFFSEQEPYVCLIHRRLTVIDPTGGVQPMTKMGKNGKYTIVYNGELYNTNALRNELLSFGYTFNSSSDTEVLLTAYIHWGEQCVEKLNGIFAFAIWNSTAQKLFLARDRIGVKPLFYSEYKDGMVFGSEIKTLLKSEKVKAEIDEEGLNELFFISPGRTGGFGVFRGVRELLPGECAIYSNGRLRVRKYFSITAKPHTHTKEQTIAKTKELLFDAVTRQLVSDVPLCCFLSGGLDSSLICTIAAQHFKRTKRGVLNTYSVDYTDNSKYFEKSLFQPNADSDYISLMSDFIHSHTTM